MNQRSRDTIHQFNQRADSHIALAMEIIEVLLGSSRSHHFLRRSLLRRFNDIKRDAQKAMRDIEDEASNTASDSVAVFTQSPASDENL